MKTLKNKSNGFIIIIIFFFIFAVIPANTSRVKKDLYKEKTLILCFHDIDGEGKYSITKQEFINILNILKPKYDVYSLKEWYLTKKRKSKKKPVIITFDDGFKSIIEIITPLLKQYNFGATYFIYTDRYEDSSSFYRQLAELPDELEIGSHTLSHDNVIAYWQKDKPKFYKEIYFSKKKLEYYTKKEIMSFAWPYGKYTIDMYEYVKNAGYKIQVSTDYGLADNSLKNKILRRITVQQPQPVNMVKNFLQIYERENGK
ncbi:MAG: polysaccharide deacetylase family protein [Spirochaetia bacterium]|nr:polysaccharide deacetylase family protein [Spirochaetia bacterium]